MMHAGGDVEQAGRGVVRHVVDAFAVGVDREELT